jgi:hypothetical protein
MATGQSIAPGRSVMKPRTLDRVRELASETLILDPQTDRAGPVAQSICRDSGAGINGSHILEWVIARVRA